MGRPRKNKPEWTGMPNSEAALTEIKNAIMQTHPCMIAIENERAQITDIFSEIHNKYGIPRRVFNALSKFSYYGNADDQFKKDNELQMAWEAIEKISS